MNRHRLLESERISKEKGKCDFRYERVENLKDGQVDVTTLNNVELGANKKCQDWGFPYGPVARTLNFQCRGPRFYPWSMGFCRQEYWSGLPCPPLGHLPDRRIKSLCLTSPPLASEFFTTSATWECPYAKTYIYIHKCKNNPEFSNIKILML